MPLGASRGAALSALWQDRSTYCAHPWSGSYEARILYSFKPMAFKVSGESHHCTFNIIYVMSSDDISSYVVCKLISVGLQKAIDTAARKTKIKIAP
jgi:hypothetical protein